MTKRGRVLAWVGRVISLLAGLLFVAGGVVKLAGGDGVKEGMAHLGLPGSLVLPIAILELACAAIYLVPATAVLGAILLTGYLGGAILAHLRVGDPFFGPIVIGAFVWLGVALRDGRLWTLLPVRRPASPADRTAGGEGCLE